MSTSGTVYIVDDDPGMRRAMARLCASTGLKADTFATASDFLALTQLDRPACILLDLCMPRQNGLDVQAELARRSIQAPVVFITGHGDIPSTVRAMKAGAVDFITKPFDHHDLLGIIRKALEKDLARQTADSETQLIHQQFHTLTPREAEVMKLVMRGMLNKQIAAELGASEQTIKVHRGRVMDKMRVESVAELVQAAVKAGLLGK